MKKLIKWIKNEWREFVSARKTIADLQNKYKILELQKSEFEKICCNNMENYYAFYKLATGQSTNKNAKCDAI